MYMKLSEQRMTCGRHSKHRAQTRARLEGKERLSNYSEITGMNGWS